MNIFGIFLVMFAVSGLIGLCGRMIAMLLDDPESIFGKVGFKIAAISWIGAAFSAILFFVSAFK